LLLYIGQGEKEARCSRRVMRSFSKGFYDRRKKRDITREGRKETCFISLGKLRYFRKRNISSCGGGKKRGPTPNRGTERGGS